MGACKRLLLVQPGSLGCFDAPSVRGSAPHPLHGPMVLERRSCGARVRHCAPRRVSTRNAVACRCARSWRCRCTPGRRYRGHARRQTRRTMKLRSVPSASSFLRRYLWEIRQFPFLTVEEERELARTSPHALVTANLRFVVKIAHEYQSYGFRLSDLIQEGNIGLMRA